MSTATLTTDLALSDAARRPAEPGVGFGKLLGYEWQRTGKWLGVVLGAAVLLWLLAMGTNMVPPLRDLSFLLVVMSGMTLGLGITVVLVLDYWRSAHGRKGYLTHLLPVQGSTQYWVRLIYGSVILGLTGALAFFSIAFTINFLETGRFFEPGLRDAFLEMVRNFGSLWWILLLVALLPFAQLGFLYFAATIGSEGVFGRMGIGGPIVMYFITQVAMQIIGLLGLLIPVGLQFFEHPDGRVGTKITQVSNLFDETNEVIPLMPFVFTGLMAIFMIVRTAWSWNKRIELR